MNEKNKDNSKRNHPSLKRTVALGAAAAALMAGSEGNNSRVTHANALKDSHQTAQYQKYVHENGSPNVNAIEAGIEGFPGVLLALGALAEGAAIAQGGIKHLRDQKAADGEAAHATPDQ